MNGFPSPFAFECRGDEDASGLRAAIASAATTIRIPLVVQTSALPRIRNKSKSQRNSLEARVAPLTIYLAPTDAFVAPARGRIAVPFVLARTPRRRTGSATLTFVLYDGGSLALDVEALEEAGCDRASLLDSLSTGAVPTRDSGGRDGSDPARWNVRQVARDGRNQLVMSAEWLQDDVHPRVGRIRLPPVRWQDANRWVAVACEALCLPRLVSTRTEPAGPNDVRVGEPGFFGRTIAARGSSEGLLRLLQLAHELPGDVLREGHVEVSATDDPSPLAFLPLATALEEAADEQRRDYVRTREIRRAPTGTLCVAAYAGSLARQQPDRVPVDRFTFCHDTDENRLFKATATRGRRVLHEGGLAALVRRRLEGVETSFWRTTSVEPSIGLVERLRARPRPELQRRALDLCEKVIRGRYPGLDVHGASFAEMDSFELDIADLFEAAARRAVAICARSHGMTVVDGNERTKELMQTEVRWRDTRRVQGLERSEARPLLMPDMLVTLGPDVIALGDVKYKAVQRADRPPYSTHAPLRREDLHQIMSYMLAWPRARWGVVVFPASDESAATKPTATTHVSTLHVGHDGSPDRQVGVFVLDAAAWNERRVEEEPLTHWIGKHVRAAAVA